MHVNKTVSLLLVFTLAFAPDLYGQRVKINGSVSDGSSGEKLIGATVYDASLGKGATTNEYGFYTYFVENGGQVRLEVSYVGFQVEILSFYAKTDTTVDVRLQPRQLEGVTVTAERERNRGSVNAVQFVSPSQLEYPSMKPDIDILDVIRQQPGVNPGLEGTVGFSVRGGNHDQNLVIMDNIPLYNTGHLANFVSIFDPYAINSMTFYKGGFPAQYGGRISSVLDIYLKEGDRQEYHGEANLGVFSGKVALEGPIQKGRSSFLVSFRRSTVDLFLSGIYALTKSESRFWYAFHDLNIKLNHKLDDRNHLYVSAYQGGDRLKTDGFMGFRAGDEIWREYASRHTNRWGNRSLSVRWNHIFSKSVFYNATLAYSGFNYFLGSRNDIRDNGEVTYLDEFNYGSSIGDLVMKHDLDIHLSNTNRIKTGLHITGHRFEPVKWDQRRVERDGMGGNSSRSHVVLQALEGYAYIQGDFSWFDDKLGLHPGLRVGTYALEESKGFNLLEPRFRVQYNPTGDSDFQLDYSRMSQTVHSLNSSGTSLTADIWVPVTERLKPAISDQVSLLYDRRVPSHGIKVQTGIYYREMKGLVDFNGNAGFTTIGGEWDRAIANNGFGRAYGFETAIEKQFEGFGLEGNYTFSRSVRRFEGLNGGRYFPQNFDRPHNLTLTSVLRLNEKTSLSLLWTYHTGQPVSLGVQAYPSINNHVFSEGVWKLNDEGVYTHANYEVADPDIVHFEHTMLVDDTNNFRMPDYHRLDLALNHTKTWKNGWKRTFGASLYNVYNRQNAYFIYAERAESQMRFYKLTLFPVLPTVSYGVKF